MSRLFLFLLLLPACLFVSGQHNPQWLRYCAISPDGKNIAFSYQGNLYKIPSAGGKATALTRGKGYDGMPVWSHDGRSIAFAGSHSGNFDLFIIPATGGEPKRLTWHSANEFPYDFSEDDQAVLFGAVRMDAAGNRQFPSEALSELYRVPVGGGRVNQILTTPAEDAKISRDGNYIVYHDRKGRENPWRKHQLSSITRDIWLYDRRNKTHTRLTSFHGEDRSPVFAGDGRHIFYLSEESGSFNVHELDLRHPSPSRQITHFSKYPVRFLTASRNNTLCFGFDGGIYLKKINSDPVRLKVRIEAPSPVSEQAIPIGSPNELTVSPDGKELAFIFRGEVFLSAADGSHVHQATHTPGEEAGPRFSPDGKALLYAAERSQRWKIYQAEIHRADSGFADGLGKETSLVDNDQENYQPEYSPDGKEIAFIENRTTIKIYNTESRKSRILLQGEPLYSRRDFDQYFAWSPNGKWLVVQYAAPGTGNDAVGIISADGKGGLQPVSESGFSNTHPAWALAGKMLLWFSDQNGLHSYANGSTRQNDVYGLRLNRLDSARYPLLTGWEKHTEKLSRQPALIADALLNENGSVLYTLSKTNGSLDLWATNLQTKEMKIACALNAEDASMQWDGDKKNIYVLADGHIVKIDPAEGRKETLVIHGVMSLRVDEERKAMFEHVWRRVKETFYTAGLHETDWDGYKTGYEKYLPDIHNNYDFAEMLNELLGELNISHAGAEYHDSTGEKDITASLGAFYDTEYGGAGLQIEEVMAEGPLDDPHFSVGPGSVIESIDGVTIGTDVDYAKFLNRKAGKNTLLVVRTGNQRTSITVKPVSPEAEDNLLYKRWVKRNEAETDSLSDGQLGYVHLYRMNDAAYRSIYALALGKFANRKALIVDTRFNRGGDLSAELTMFLSGIRTRLNTTDQFAVSGEPAFRWTKPSVVLANEANYSDASCFVYDYQYLHMGKLVGMPVPGSCTFNTGQSLPDNTLHWSVPTLGVKDLKGQYLENRQTLPDIQVMNEYDQVASGRDQQLEAAIKQSLKTEGAVRSGGE